jgi:hypothetical protein
MSDYDSATRFGDLMAQYKQLIISREDECKKLRLIFLKEAKKQGRKARFSKSFLIVAGALMATKGTSDLLMLKLEWSAKIEMLFLIIYTIIGVAVAVMAGLDAAFRFESKAARLNFLAAMCQNHNRAYMSDYLKYLGSSSDRAIIQQRIEDLVDARNKDLERILDGANEVGVDTSEVDISYSTIAIGSRLPPDELPPLPRARPVAHPINRPLSTL